MRHDECEEKTSLDGLITALDWKDQTVKDAIHSFKYEGVKELAKFLAVFLNVKIQNSPLFFRFVSECHAVIPMPLHRRNALLRGYNQSKLLAEELTRFLPIRVHEDIVRKARSTKTQTKLKGIERFENVAQTFQIIPGADVKGGKFVVVDDVVTSGATMNEVAKVLKQNGALLVWGLAVTRG